MTAAAGPASAAPPRAPDRGVLGDSRATVVAIDGQSGSGKSTLARALAHRLGWRYLDTGAMYRAVTLAALEQGIAPADGPALGELAARLALVPGTDPEAPRLDLGGRDVTQAVRRADVTAAVSAVSAVPRVREVLTARQREIAESGRIVVEGRDIGTVVLPDAGLKVWLSVDAEQAGERRARDEGETSDAQRRALAARDAADSSRTVAPSRPAEDAVLLDSSHTPVDALVADLVARLGLLEESGGSPSHEEPVDGAATLVRRTGPTRPGLVAVARAIGRFLVVPGFDLRISGTEHVPAGGPVLLVGNHVKAVDGPFLYAASPRPARFLVKAEAFHGPLAAWLSAIDQWPVNRGRADRTALAAARDELVRGGVVAIFPEGTRGDGSVARVHDGIGWLLAHCPSAVVVPVALLHGRSSRGTAVRFGPPLELDRATATRTRAGFHHLASAVASGLAAHVAGAARADQLRGGPADRGTHADGTSR